MIDRKITEDTCTGCKMCGDLCPRKAIRFEINEEGFWLPETDERMCSGCGLCVKKCPVLNENKPVKEEPEVYSAWLKDDKMRLQSTSGGVYYALAKRFTDEGGYLAGCRYSEDCKTAYHVCGKGPETLNRLIGSKYFQSDTAGIYSEVRELLNRGEKVLFCGTPCQSAALQSFLERKYENLYLVDFVCRGINSPLAFRKHLEELEEQYHSKVKRVQLKNKLTGWQSLATYVEFENGASCHQDKNHSMWVKGFVGGAGLFNRKSCYHCKFKGLPRISDVTVGDFWGITGKSGEDMFKGISLVMINSDKGRELFEAAADTMIYEKSTLVKAVPGNPALLTSLKENRNRARFFRLLKTHTFRAAVKSCTHRTLGSILRKAGGKMKRILHKLYFFRKLSVFKFVRYNFFSSNVVREPGIYLLPYRNAVLDLSREARIYLKGRNLELGINKLRGSKAETHLRMSGNAKWYANGGGALFYDTVLEIKNNAVFETGYFTANGGSVIICAKRIKLGEDVMLGRNIVIYDSDYHQVQDEKGHVKNLNKEVCIGDHVWLTNQIMVLKGVHIGAGTLVSPFTVLRKDLPAGCMVGNTNFPEVIGENIRWSRDLVPGDAGLG